ncbi:MAG TPA: hypothetical protein VEL51_12930 [Vicinamibacterales bacterium]|nr:hypothetical protein [Vicinamibacterales bacterium]
MFRTAALAGLMALALGPAPNQSRRISLEAADCSRINMMFGDYEVARAVQHGTVPVSAGTLELRPEFNGGVKIERGSGNAYDITACIGAGGRTLAEAQAAVDNVKLVIDGSRVHLTGTADSTSRIHSWSVQLIVTAPDGAHIDAETTNGPISVSGVSGTLALRASNGPIAMEDVNGDVRARASNGPITVEGSRGRFDIETANGPIDVRLDGRRWDGRLDARAANGPLTVSVPADYQSGVEISSAYHSPWSCRVAACQSGTKDWDERSRSLRIGGDPIAVRLSTVNGPVTVRER